jgi:prophage regulatory protein
LQLFSILRIVKSTAFRRRRPYHDAVQQCKRRFPSLILDTNFNEVSPVELLSINQVLERTGLPRSTFYWKRAHGEFPAPVRLGRFVAWRDDVIFHWLRDQRWEATST